MNASRFFVPLSIIICLVLSPVIALMQANTAQAQATRGPWPMFGQNAQHTHRSPYSGPEVPKLKWSFTTGGPVQSSPAIGTDGTIYVGSWDYRLYAIDPDGTEKWSFAAGDRINSSPAIVVDGTIYVGSWDGNLYAINPDGTLRWSFTTSDDIASSPAITPDGRVHVGSTDGKLYVIFPTGSQHWSFTTGGPIGSSPAISIDCTTSYFGSVDGKLYAGIEWQQQWAFTTGGWIISSPAVGVSGTIYVGSMDNKLYATNPDGSHQWAFTTGGWVASSPAIAADGTIYVGSDDGNLYAINPNGSQKWYFTTGGPVQSSPTIGADGTIYVGSNDDNLYAINPDGSQKWSFATGDDVFSSPAIGADGTIYVGSDDGNLYAITEEFDLTISSTTGGSVIVPDEGVFPYDRGTVVTLVAEAEEGYSFINWTGDVASIDDVEDATTTITMNGDYSITASFQQISSEFDLTISSTTGGSVADPGEGIFTYDQGIAVNLVAEDDSGYSFVNWTGDIGTIADVNDATTTITMNGDYSITANFEEEPSDGEPSDGGTTDGGCFIATAAYGTPMAGEVEVLREFRDEYLLTNPVGQALVDLYYEVSPPMAEFINGHPGLKPVVRAGLLPAVAMSTVAVNTGPAEKMAIVGFLALAAVAVAVGMTRRRGRSREYSPG